MLRQGGVHNYLMQREWAVGVSSRDGIVEVAFEQRTEQAADLQKCLSKLRRNSYVTGKQYRIRFSYWQSAEKGFSEVRW